MSAVQRDSKLAREIKDADFRPGNCYFVLTMPQKDDSQCAAGTLHEPHTKPANLFGQTALPATIHLG